MAKQVRLTLAKAIAKANLRRAEAGASTLSYESKFECARDSSNCDQSSATFDFIDLVLNTAAPTVFAIYSGYLARKARERLGIDRKTAIKLLAKY